MLGTLCSPFCLPERYILLQAKRCICVSAMARQSRAIVGTISRRKILLCRFFLEYRHGFPRVIAEPRARPAPSISPSLVRKTLESRQVAPLPSSARSHALRATSACCRSNLSVPSRYALWCSLSECRASRFSPGHVVSDTLDPWPETPHTPTQSGSSRLARGPLRINR